MKDKQQLPESTERTNTGSHEVDGTRRQPAAAGYLNPLVAALIHVASELTFILNSTRLLPPQRPACLNNPKTPEQLSSE